MGQITPLERVRSIGKALFGGAVALAGAITAIAAALFIVAPQLAPREKLGAELDRIAIQQGASYDEYSPHDEGSYVPLTGIIVYVHAKLSGFEDRSYVLGVRAYDAETQAPLDQRTDSPPVFSTCEYKSPTANEDGVAWRCWMVAPPVGARYFIRAQLFDSGPTQDLGDGDVTGQDELLDFTDSQPLTSLGPDL